MIYKNPEPYAIIVGSLEGNSIWIKKNIPSGAILTKG